MAGAAPRRRPAAILRPMRFFASKLPNRDVQRERREWVLDQQRWKHQRDIERGYRIKWGYVAIAYLVEFMSCAQSFCKPGSFAGTAGFTDRELRAVAVTIRPAAPSKGASLSQHDAPP